MYDTEQLLVDDFINGLMNNDVFGNRLSVGVEFNYQRGRTDVIVLNSSSQLYAFEAKLLKWRDALQQAYRNKCFAEMSYVVLPSQTSINAYKYIEEFRRRGVGLCVVKDDGNIEVLIESDYIEPLQIWLRNKAVDYIKSEEDINGGNNYCEGDLQAV